MNSLRSDSSPATRWWFFHYSLDLDLYPSCFPDQVQRHLHLRVEAQGKYLQSILEKACKVLNEQTLASSGLEATRQELSELAIKVSNDCSNVPCDSLKLPLLSEIVAACLDEKSLHRATQIANYSVDSCLTSTEILAGISMVGSSQTALKKRPRPIFGEGESLAWGNDLRQGTQWMTSSIGWDVSSWGRGWWGKSVLTSVYYLRRWSLYLTTTCNRSGLAYSQSEQNTCSFSTSHRGVLCPSGFISLI